MPHPNPSSKGPEVCAYVMGHTIKNGEQEGSHGQLGACPFSLRVLLSLEEKGILYKPEYINLKNKPTWLTEVNPAGTVPVLKDLDQFVVDSDAICDYLEEKYKGTYSLGKLSAVPHPGANLGDLFAVFAKSGDAQARTALEEALREVEAAVPNDHPFCGGKRPNAWDMALAPRLYLARVGCKQLRDWDFAEDFPNIKAYLHRITGRPSWRNTASWDEESIVEDIKGWMQKPEVGHA